MERKKASDFPQELLDIFHEYVHGEIDRRTFLSKAGKFAVGGLAAAAAFGIARLIGWPLRQRSEIELGLCLIINKGCSFIIEINIRYPIIFM